MTLEVVLGCFFSGRISFGASSPPLVLEKVLTVCFFKVDSMRFCIIGAWD